MAEHAFQQTRWSASLWNLVAQLAGLGGGSPLTSLNAVPEILGVVGPGKVLWRNKAAARVEQALAEPFMGGSLDLLMTVYKDETLPWSTRIEAAKAALPYEKPRLQPVEANGAPGKTIDGTTIIRHELTDESIKKIANLVK